MRWGGWLRGAEAGAGAAPGGSTLVTSQLPLEKWHDIFADPTFADAILDRLVHNAYKLKLKGGSMRRKLH